jgi:hypothetical protein
MKFWKYYKMGKFIIETIRRESIGEHCGHCSFQSESFCVIYGYHIIGNLRKGDCKKEAG